MKKILVMFICLFVMFSLCSCDNKDSKISIISPSGTPSLALASFYENNKDNVDYEIVNGSDPLIAAFVNGSKDIIVAPVNLGAKMYNQTGKYIYYKTIVWGNLYLVSKKTLNSFNDLDGKELVVFGQNSTPDIIIKGLLSSKKSLNVNLTYVSDVATANSLLMSGSADYIVSAEPSLSKLRQKADLNILDLQEEWSNTFSTESYPQAGLFVNKDIINDSKVKNLLNSIVNDIENIDNKVLSSDAVNIDSSFATIGKDVLELSIPKCNFKIITNYDDEINSVKLYLQKMIDLGFGKQVGDVLPDEEFFKH